VGQPVLLTSGLSYGILTAGRPEQLAAWLLLRWLMLPRNQAHLVEISGSLPLGPASADLLREYRLNNPQWASIVDLLPQARITPRRADWRTARRILEDSIWQLYQPYTTPERIPALLERLDATLTELTQAKQP
jgi:ABC-type glycerol-3-phosphate transport system substrate-binding protein